MISLERLKEVLEYDSNTGLFRWRVRKSCRTLVGSVAGSVDRKGYIIVFVDGKAYKAHRLAWFYIFGKWPTEQIDHINGIKNDNRKENLRLASNMENQWNQKIPKNNTSGYKGVSFHKRYNRWMASVSFKNKKVFLGYYETPELAYQAANEARKRLHKEFSNNGE